jgi:hypothetical protein
MRWAMTQMTMKGVKATVAMMMISTKFGNPIGRTFEEEIETEAGVIFDFVKGPPLQREGLTLLRRRV